jgi:hypothetical protein
MTLIATAPFTVVAAILKSITKLLHESKNIGYHTLYDDTLIIQYIKRCLSLKGHRQSRFHGEAWLLFKMAATTVKRTIGIIFTTLDYILFEIQNHLLYFRTLYWTTVTENLKLHR